MIYGYARVSTDKPDQATSLPNQIKELEEFAKSIDDEWGGVYVDDGVSAFKVKLRDRPSGRRMHDALTQGDTVIAVSYSRLWRQDSDRTETREAWNNQGITLQILGQAPQKPQRRQNTTEWLQEKMYGVFDEMRSRTDGDSQHRVAVTGYREQTPYGPTRPFGWLVKGRKYKENKKEREIAALIIHYHEVDGLSFEKIVLKLKFAGVRKPVCQRKSSGIYHKPDVYGLYKAAKDGFPKVPQSPSLVSDSS
mgnify:CR=1 FL=1